MGVNDEPVKAKESSMKLKTYRPYLLSFFSILLFSCASKKPIPEGEIVGTLDAQTYQAHFKGPVLKLGEKVKIIEYNWNTDIPHRHSRILPDIQEKRIIGQATITTILNDNYYELKTEKPQYIPNDAFIEKY